MPSPWRLGLMALLVVGVAGRGLADAPKVDAPEVDSPAVKELSVAPLDHVVYPDSRPDWIDAPDSDTRIVVQSGPHESPEAARRHLKILVPVSIELLVERNLSSEVAGELRKLYRDDINFDSLRYDGTLSVGGETRHESAVELRLKPEAMDQLMRRHRSLVVGGRTAKLVGLSLGTIAMVGVTGLGLRAVDRRRNQGQGR